MRDGAPLIASFKYLVEKGDQVGGVSAPRPVAWRSGKEGDLRRNWRLRGGEVFFDVIVAVGMQG